MRDNDLMSWYTVYNAKTDEIVACGTADMIVRQMGYVNKNSLYSAVTHSKTRKGPPRLYIYHVQKVRREELPLRSGQRSTGKRLPRYGA